MLDLSGLETSSLGSGAGTVALTEYCVKGPERLTKMAARRLSVPHVRILA